MHEYNQIQWKNKYSNQKAREILHSFLYVHTYLILLLILFVESIQHKHVCTYERINIFINISGVCATRKTKMRDLKKTVFIYRFSISVPTFSIFPIPPRHLFFLFFPASHPSSLPTFCVRTCCPFLNNEKEAKKKKCYRWNIHTE